MVPAAPKTSHVVQAKSPGKEFHLDRWNGEVGEGCVHSGADGTDRAEGWDQSV